MGRRTYEIFSEQWPRTDGPYAERLNRIRKYVFSSKLTDLTWDNTVVIDGDVVEGVRQLKAAATGELAIYGRLTARSPPDRRQTALNRANCRPMAVEVERY